jgi:hypothetical protein
MSAESHLGESPGEGDETPTDRIRVSAFLWRPWYAKLWWALIPLYWLAAGEPTRPPFLNPFFESGYSVVISILFTPITAIVVLGARMFRKAAASSDLVPLDTEKFGWRGPGVLPPWLDETNPASGPLWIGNQIRDQVLHDLSNRH